jgi:hypothetical protein
MMRASSGIASPLVVVAEPSKLSWCASTIGMTRRSDPPTVSSVARRARRALHLRIPRGELRRLVEQVAADVQLADVVQQAGRLMSSICASFR